MGLLQTTRVAILDPDGAGAVEQDLSAAGLELLEFYTCLTCHSLAGEGMDSAPPLDHTGSKFQTAYLREFLIDPPSKVPDIDMPPFDGPADELDTLIRFLESLK